MIVAVMALAVILVAAFLFGSIPFGFLIGRMGHGRKI